MINTIRNLGALRQTLGGTGKAMKFMKSIKPLKKDWRNEVIDFTNQLKEGGYSNISAKCSGAERVTVESSRNNLKMSNDIDFKNDIMCQTTESNVMAMLPEFMMPFRNVTEKIWTNINNGMTKFCKTVTKYACQNGGETKRVSTIIDNPVTGNKFERIEQNGVKTYYKYINGKPVQLFANK